MAKQTLSDTPEQTLEQAEETGSAFAAFSESKNYKIPVKAIKERLDGLLSTIEAMQSEAADIKASLLSYDGNVVTDTNIEADSDSVTLATKTANLKTGEEAAYADVLPVATLSYAGVMDSAMFQAFTDMQDSVTTIMSIAINQPRTAVVKGLGNEDANATLTSAFTEALGEPPAEADRLINADNQSEWIFDGEDWLMLAVIPLNLASQTNDGLVTHSTLDGCVGYYVHGVGQVNGWSDLKSRVAANKESIAANASAIAGKQNAIPGSIDKVFTDAEVNTATGRPANSLARRSPSGYLSANYFNQQSPNSENPMISQVFVQNSGDNFLRKASLAHLKSSLGVGAAFPGFGSVSAIGASNSAGTASTAARSDHIHATPEWIESKPASSGNFVLIEGTCRYNPTLRLVHVNFAWRYTANVTARSTRIMVLPNNIPSPRETVYLFLRNWNNSFYHNFYINAACNFYSVSNFQAMTSDDGCGMCFMYAY